jgi:hypothetical protein
MKTEAKTEKSKKIDTNGAEMFAVVLTDDVSS